MPFFQTRDRESFYYKEYMTDQSDRVMVLLHGISEDHQYLAPFASFIADQGLATVYTPDLRGYGQYTNKKGDITYIGQHEADLTDFLIYLKQIHPNALLILAGHSAGGGTVLRFSKTSAKRYVDAYILLAPMVHYRAPIIPIMRQNRLGLLFKKKLIALHVLERIGIRKLHHQIVYHNPKPKEKIHGRETLALSFRLFVSRYPSDYRQTIQQLTNPTLVLVGNSDEVFIPEAYPALFSDVHLVQTQIIHGADHDGILRHKTALMRVKDWIERTC